MDSIISRVQGHDNEQDILTFGLESLHSGFNGGGGDAEDLPFRIDQNTGIVYLNESLEGRGGEKFFLYVTAFDGALTAKTEVYVNIRKRGETPNSGGPGTFNPHKTNISQLLPPFHLLPGVQARPQNIPINPPPLPPGFATTSGDPVRRPPASGGGQTFTYPDPKTKEGGRDKNNTATNRNEDGADVSQGINPTVSSTERQNGTAANSTTTFLRPSFNTMLPISIIICGILVAAGLIVSFLFRKRLCAIGKSLKKKSKEEMAKKSNQSNLSSCNNTVTTASEGSRNSMVMQHWNGPTAFGNRYVPWERENQHIQVLDLYFINGHKGWAAGGWICFRA